MTVYVIIIVTGGSYTIGAVYADREEANAEAERLVAANPSHIRAYYVERQVGGKDIDTDVL